jgi:hypothetical protein
MMEDTKSSLSSIDRKKSNDNSLENSLCDSNDKYKEKNSTYQSSLTNNLYDSHRSNDSTIRLSIKTDRRASQQSARSRSKKKKSCC